MRDISILGSTGSIGTSTLDVIRQSPEMFNVVGLSCGTNIKTLARQIGEFKPGFVSVAEGFSGALKAELVGLEKQPDVLEGTAGNLQVATSPKKGIVVAAMMGAQGINPVLAAIEAGNTIALANKEALVMSGALLIREAKKHQIKILPIDSEHNAIFQSLRDEPRDFLSHVTLTASGGPFLRKPTSEFPAITLAEALNHPNWNMGKKITVDSATMMNKCLEIIEAKWLFDLDLEQIKVLIHPQSIIHSMVTFNDGSTISQMGVPDMRTPISYCLGYPDRIRSGSNALDLPAIGALEFIEPDVTKFPALDLAFKVLDIGYGAPAALNGANEYLVSLFLEEKIAFIDIPATLSNLVNEMKRLKDTENCPAFLKGLNDLDGALDADIWGRNFAKTNSEQSI